MKRTIIKMAVLALLLAAGAVSVVFAQASGNKYVGAEKCKNCHSSAAKGDQYGNWKKEKHAVAVETLSTDKAKEAGKAKGVADPATDPKCLKCHVTAYSEPAGMKDPKFDPKQGVQCESCHGPGGNHVKARLMAAANEEEGDVFGGGGDDKPKQIPAGEINAKPDAKVCTTCHNSESPSYKEFKYDEFVKKIAHPDPRKSK
ncbi:MAG TPA: cytochrome c family protein [bacterium]|nr:cytochrome c family protein [bacterium]